MAGSHSERADELAAQGNKALAAALAASDGALKAGTLGRAEVAAELDERWTQLAAIQRQAEIHARLATNDTLFSRGFQ